jgi:hypothetical protein
MELPEKEQRDESFRRCKVTRDFVEHSAANRLWNYANCDICRDGAYGFPHGGAVCYANSNLNTHPGSDRDTYANSDCHADAYTHA